MRILLCSPDLAPEPWLEALINALPGAEVLAWEPGAPPADYALVWNPPQAFFDEQPDLRAAFNLGAGVDALLELNLPPELPIVRLEDAGMGALISEYVLQAVIRHYRELPASEAEMRAGLWNKRHHRSRKHFPVGVLGLGRLGRQVARTLAQLDFTVHGWSRSEKEINGVQSHVGPEQFHDFLGASRILVNLLPLTPHTRNILNRDTLSRLQSPGYLINVGRGAHLVEEDLLELIASGQMAGAALDVYQTEPLPADHPFRQNPAISLTPHVAAMTTRYQTLEQISGKIQALERGEQISGVVDRKRGY